MSKEIKIDNLREEILDVLENFQDDLFVVTDEALESACDEVLIPALKANSPKKTGNYSENWDVKRKYKLKKFVGNKTRVSGAEGEIPLSNILEFSKKRKRPHIRRTINECIPRMAEHIVNQIKSSL